MNGGASLRLLAQPEDDYRDRPSPSYSSGGILRNLSSIAGKMKPNFALKSSRPAKLRRTAYLDGLRGFAAFLVYILHNELWAHSWEGQEIMENAWGFNGKYYFTAFPGIRVLFTGGHLAVATFFVLSGYVLSTKPLTLIQSGELHKMTDNIASALFRRWMRLWFPIIVVTFGIALIPHLTGVWAGFKAESNIWDEMWKYYCDMKNFTYIFNNTLLLDYHAHIWSIPIEFKGSIVVYTTCLAFSRCTKNARLWCEVGLMFYFMYIVDGAHMAMFVMGIFQADLDLLALSGDLPDWMYKLSPHKITFAWAAFFVAILFGGVPPNNREITHLQASPGWYYLSFLKPQAVWDFKWFFLFWAAACFVFSAGRLPWFKRFLETNVCLYLGRVSFMLYLFHGPVLWTLGDRLYAATGWVHDEQMLNIPTWTNAFPITKWGPAYGLELSWLVPQLILLPVTFWLAELGTTFIDDPAIKLAAWLFKQTGSLTNGPGTQHEMRSTAPP
jgi:peptidoglycan/LPS O-acetylase OafA/YrhL